MKKHLLLQTLHNDKHEVFDGKNVSEISEIFETPNGAHTDVLAKLTGWKQDIRRLQVHQVTTDKREYGYSIKTLSTQQKTSNNWIKNTLINISWIFILKNNQDFHRSLRWCFFRQESCWNAAAIAESPQGLAVMSPLKLPANAPEKLGRIQGGEMDDLPNHWNFQGRKC